MSERTLSRTVSPKGGYSAVLDEMADGFEAWHQTRHVRRNDEALPKLNRSLDLLPSGSTCAARPMSVLCYSRCDAPAYTEFIGGHLLADIRGEALAA